MASSAGFYTIIKSPGIQHFPGLYDASKFKYVPEYEKYALCDQSRRAVISIPSKIAEGLGRMAVKERIHFLEIAYSSLNEVTCQMDIAQALNYITSEELDNIESMSAELGKILSGLRQSLINKIR